MTTIDRVAALKRPSLLIRAARHGVPEYDRETMLRRLVDARQPGGGEAIVDALLDAEAEAEGDRKAGLATYSFGRHIELLVALMVEARLAATAT